MVTLRCISLRTACQSGLASICTAKPLPAWKSVDAVVSEAVGAHLSTPSGLSRRVFRADPNAIFGPGFARRCAFAENTDPALRPGPCGKGRVERVRRSTGLGREHRNMGRCSHPCLRGLHEIGFMPL